MDVDAIDLVRIGGRHTPRNRRSRNPLVEPHPLQRGHCFRIADTRNIPRGVQHDSGRDDRPREAATADFVDASDIDEAHAPDGVLERSEGADLHEVM